MTPSVSFAFAAALAAAPSLQDEGAGAVDAHEEPPAEALVEAPPEGAPADVPPTTSTPTEATPTEATPAPIKKRTTPRPPSVRVRVDAHEVPVPLVAEGVTVTATVVDKKGQRYRMIADAKGTVLISVDSIHGPAPNVKLMNAEGKTIRRGVRGKSFARPNPGDELVLEVTPPYKDAASTYQVSVAFEIDRPREQRHLPRPLRPRDIVRVSGAAAPDLDQVTVGGLPADFAIHGGDVLVTIPGFARSGEVELRYESRAPRTKTIALIGTAKSAVDRTGLCRGPGCISLTLSPSAGPQWLDAIAKLLDADVVSHTIATGSVVLKLRLPSAEGIALEQLRRMGSVTSVQRVAMSTTSPRTGEVTQAPLSP